MRRSGQLRLRRRRWLGWLLFATFWIVRSGFAQTPEGDLARLQERARSLHLAQSRAWLGLLHMHGGQSELRGRDFFLSPTGQNDAQAELDATLASWFAPVPPQSLPNASTEVAAREDVDAQGRLRVESMHPICRFPARAIYLTQQLDMTGVTLPAIRCPHTERFFARVGARSVTLVFSGYHLSAPASAFGHTFLRLNKQSDAGRGRALELLDQAVDFAADVDTGNPLAYAIKGMTGAFPGVFHVLPYYYKVREYNDFESRDLWEFDLDLAPDRVGLLVAHIWELGWSYAPYYYASGNCAYHVLALLDAVAPRLALTDGLSWPVLPVHAVQQVAASPGLVRAVRFRASTRRQFETRVGGLSGREQAAVADLADDPSATLANLAVPRQAAVLDAAADLVDLRNARELVFEPHHPIHQLRRALLERRAELAFPSPELPEALPEAERVDRSHKTRRIGIAGAFDGAPGALLDARLTMHDWADPPTGYPQLGRIEFLAVRAGWLSQPGRFVLERGDLLYVATLLPVDRFRLKPSWQFRLGADQRMDRICPGCVLGTAQVSGGLTLATAARSFAGYVLTDVLVQGGPHAAASWPWVPFGVQAGGLAGIRLELHERAVLTSSIALRYAINEARGWTVAWDAKLRWRWTESVSLGLEGLGADSAWRSSFGAYWYF